MMKEHFGLPTFIFVFLVCISAAWSARVTPHAATIKSSDLKTTKFGEVLYDPDADLYRFVASASESGIGAARGSFSDASFHVSDFGQLRVNTSSAYSDRVQMKAAGYLEAYLTAGRISDYSHNIRQWLFGKTNDTQKVFSWLAAQDAWIQEQLATRAREAVRSPSNKLSDESLFWDAIQTIMDQFEGIVEGYAAAVAAQDDGPEAAAANGALLTPLSRVDLLLLQALGDVEDIIPIVSGTENTLAQGPKKKLEEMSPAEVRASLAMGGRCSALIKVTSDLSDILVGHVTWWYYMSMMRVYKHYNFALHNPKFHGLRQSFSSYPATLTSIDDWHLLGSGLLVTETTNDVYNVTLYKQSNNQAALNWQRVRVANLLATTGPQWGKWLSTHNSGTYNNQYMVIDFKRFTPGKSLKHGLLTIIEIIPGMSMSADATQELERGYWPSYNVPYFEEIYNKTGYSSLSASLAKLGPEYASVLPGLEYQLAPRAKIFRRDQGFVEDLASLKALLRSNRWTNDRFSSHSPWDAICSRGDLDPHHPDAYGCYDGKVTSYHLYQQMAAEAVNGPTTYDGNSPFSWSKSEFNSIPHRGLRDTFDTVWELQKP